MGENTDAFLGCTVSDEAGTERLAQALGTRLAVGDVVLLSGTLGAGKTAFSRALIRAVSGDPTLIAASPTFTFSQIYTTPDLLLTHFDLYRMGESEEVFDLGWDDALADGATLVEWPERLGPLAPSTALTMSIELDPIGETARRFTLSGDAAWAARWVGFSL